MRAAGYGEAVYCPICNKALNKLSGKNDYFCWNCSIEVSIFKGRLRAYKYTGLGNKEKILDIKYEKKAVEKKKYPRNVVQYEKETMREIGRFDSIREASKKTGANESGISQCCRKAYKQAGGFVWRFADV